MEDRKVKFCLTCDALINIADGRPIHSTRISSTGVLVADVLERCLLLADVNVLDSDVVCSTCYQHLQEYSTLEFKFKELKNLLWALYRETSVKRGNDVFSFIHGVEVQTEGMTALPERHTTLNEDNKCFRTFKVDMNSEGDNGSNDDGNMTVDVDLPWHTDNDAPNEESEPSSLNCAVCGLVLPSSDALRVHQVVFRHFGHQDCVKTETDMDVKPTLPRLCKLCGEEYVGFTGLKKHMARYHATLRFKFKCHFCGEVLRTHSKAQIHCKAHSFEFFDLIADASADDVKFRAVSLDDDFPDDEPLARRKDFLSVLVEDPLKAPEEIKTNSKQALSELKKINSIVIRKVQTSKKKKERNTNSMKSSPKYISSSVNVMKINNDPEETEFDMAGYMKKTDRMKTKGNEASDEGDDIEFVIPPNKEPKHECEICHKKWRTKGELKGHMSAHSDVRPFICEICGQGYKQKKGLVIHIQMHNGVYPFQCRNCKKVFTQKKSLKRHILIHTGERPHQCELCGKRFLHISSFNIHTMGHTGERPIKCKVCNVRVLSKSHLIRHMRIHSGEKPYECTTCGKSFAEKYNLVAHQRIHDPNPQTPGRQKKKHMCRLCSSVFTSAPKLELHVSQDHVKTVIQLAGAS